MDSKIENKTVSIPVGEKGSTTGVISLPTRGSRGAGIVVAHGAGNDMESPLIVSFTEGLAMEGYPSMRFNFLYREKGRKTPDREEVLYATWEAAFRFFADAIGEKPFSLVAAGKSLGGRIASQMVADGLLPAKRLIFLGYPLHPADNKEKLKDSHFHKIDIPMLFFAGTRDPLCDITLIRGVLGHLSSPWNLHVVQGGDHSFHVPKSQNISEKEIFSTIVGQTLDWLRD